MFKFKFTKYYLCFYPVDLTPKKAQAILDYYLLPLLSIVPPLVYDLWSGIGICCLSLFPVPCSLFPVAFCSYFFIFAFVLIKIIKCLLPSYARTPEARGRGLGKQEKAEQARASASKRDKARARAKEQSN
jgi:hypothetical protein